MGKDRYFFRTVPSDKYQGRALADFLVAGPTGADGAAVSCDRAAIVAIDNAYGHELAGHVRERFTGADGSGFTGAVAIETYVPATVAEFTSAEATLDEVIAAKADCQVLVAYEDTACVYLKAMAARGNAMPAAFFTVATDGVHNKGLLQACRSTITDATSTNAAVGLYGTIAGTSADTENFRQFAKIYGQVFPATSGAMIDSYAANMFDAAILTALAVQAAGGVDDRVKLRDALVASSKGGTRYSPFQLAQALADARDGLDIDYQGASGDVDIDETTGDVAGPFLVWRVDQTPGAEPTYTSVKEIPFSQIEN